MENTLFNGCYKLFVCSHFSFYLFHSSNSFVQLDRVLALYVSFPSLLYFYFIHFICINLIINILTKPVHSSYFPFPFFLLFHSLIVSIFDSFIYIFHLYFFVELNFCQSYPFSSTSINLFYIL